MISGLTVLMRIGKEKPLVKKHHNLTCRQKACVSFQLKLLFYKKNNGMIPYHGSKRSCRKANSRIAEVHQRAVPEVIITGRI